VDDGFKRTALSLILIQPKTLFEGPISEIQKHAIRVDNAKFKSLGIDKNKHVIEISGPTLNRGLYKINEVQSDTVIIPAHPPLPDFPGEFPADLTPENQRPFTIVQNYIFTPKQGKLQSNGFGANNPGLLPFDMVEIRKSITNDGIYQVQPIGTGAISGEVAVYEALSQEDANGAEARGVIFIRVREERFCDAADSGAVVVNDAAEVVGLLAGPHADVDLGLLLRKRLEMRGTVLRARGLEEKISVTEAFARHIVPLVARGDLKPIVDRIFPLAEAAAAHAYVGENRGFGKAVLELT
jgi:hypothetical protein